MTQGVDLRSLLERVQKAQGPDHDLDAFLFRAFPEGFMLFSITPLITSSLDHTVAMVSKLLPGRIGVFD